MFKIIYVMKKIKKSYGQKHASQCLPNSIQSGLFLENYEYSATTSAIFLQFS